MRNLLKKKKTMVLTNVGKRAVEGYYIPVGKGQKKKKKPLVLTNVGKRAVKGAGNTYLPVPGI